MTYEEMIVRAVHLAMIGLLAKHHEDSSGLPLGKSGLIGVTLLRDGAIVTSEGDKWQVEVQKLDPEGGE
jgi:hypothetical protein